MKASLIRYIREFVSTYGTRAGTATRWASPVVGMADASDALFERLAQVVSPTHAMPRDVLWDARTVIAWFLPFERETARSNAEGRLSSPQWAAAYVETNEMIRELGLELERWFAARGWRSAVIPATHNWNEEKLISDWSHRHVAYIAGLGRFGLNNMLITSRGCCGRLGSFVTDAGLEPDPRPEGEACLYKHDGTCGRCIKRCGTGALTPLEFDRFRCYDLCMENVTRHKSAGYADVCGKCLVEMPCSHADPVARKRARG